MFSPKTIHTISKILYDIHNQITNILPKKNEDNKLYIFRVIRFNEY